MCSFKAVVHSHVDGVSAEPLNCGPKGGILILLKNNGNEEMVEKPLALYLLPVGTPIKKGSPAFCLIPTNCDLVYVDVIKSELKHISGKTSLEVLVYGPEGSNLREKFCC